LSGRRHADAYTDGYTYTHRDTYTYADAHAAADAYAEAARHAATAADAVSGTVERLRRYKAKKEVERELAKDAFASSPAFWLRAPRLFALGVTEPDETRRT